MGLQLTQNESQGMPNRGSFTPTTEEDLDMIQVIQRQNITCTSIETCLLICFEAEVQRIQISFPEEATYQPFKYI